MPEADMEFKAGMAWSRWIGMDAAQPGMEHRALEPEDTTGLWTTQIELGEQAWCIIRGGGSIRVSAMGECCEI
eukprot:4346817-Prorocentrum_lima.AAC.1